MTDQFTNASDADISVSEILLYRILRPNQAMDPKGQQMVAYLLLGLLLIIAPAIMLTGLWELLLFLLSPVLMIVVAFIYHNYKLRIYEEITITHSLLNVTQVRPNGEVLEFRNDPHWVKIELQKDGGPVENYLTISDENRRVELGRFLSPEERQHFYQDLIRVKSKL